MNLPPLLEGALDRARRLVGRARAEAGVGRSVLVEAYDQAALNGGAQAMMCLTPATLAVTIDMCAEATIG